MKSLLNNYFGFNRQQRNGLLVLMTVSLALLAVRIVYPYFMDDSTIEVRYIPPAALSDSTATEDDSLFRFDPNTATFADLEKLGFTKKAAATLIKYRKRHRLRTADDLKKVYGVTAALAERLAPYMVFGESRVSADVPQNKTTAAKEIRQEAPPVELNDADSAALVAVRGIGPVFAKRILKYRDLLGGFVRREQLMEVYGITEEAYLRMRDHVTVDPGLCRKVNLNSDDFKTVNRHPYISYEFTKSIFKARRAGLLDTAALRTLAGNDSLYRKLLPYAAF